MLIIKMKTHGVNISLNGNIGFTLPSNMGELDKIERLDLSNCLLTGMYSNIHALSYQSDSVTCFWYVLTGFGIPQVPSRLNWANWRI